MAEQPLSKNKPKFSLHKWRHEPVTWGAAQERSPLPETRGPQGQARVPLCTQGGTPGTLRGLGWGLESVQVCHEVHVSLRRLLEVWTTPLPLF